MNPRSLCFHRHAADPFGIHSSQPIASLATRIDPIDTDCFVQQPLSSSLADRSFSGNDPSFVNRSPSIFHWHTADPFFKPLLGLLSKPRTFSPRRLLRTQRGTIFIDTFHPSARSRSSNHDEFFFLPTPLSALAGQFLTNVEEIYWWCKRSVC